MEFIIIILLLILMILILAIVYEINIKKLKQFAKEEEAKFNPLSEKYPPNIDICKAMLKRIKNDSVKIEENANYDSSFYIAVSNKIIIANVRNSYTRIQTIAHECLHSIQNRKILLFNFIFSNIYLLYFIIVSILGFLKVLPYKNIFLFAMLILSYMYYFIRSYLEMDAMTKAKFLAKEYMEEINISSKEEIDLITESYDKLNDIGIKATNFGLMFETIGYTVFMALVFCIFK